MSAAFEPVQLRPLGVGEILDRAVTLYVRNWLLFAIIAAFVVVPMSVAQYFLTVQSSGAWVQILQQMQHPSRTAPATPFGPWLGVFVGVSFVCTPFMYVAMASALARIYNGQSADWRRAYGVALRHAGGILATVICEAIVLIAVAFTGAFVLGLAFVAAFLLVRSSAPLGVAMIVVAIALLVAYIVWMMLCYLALALAFEAIGIEQAAFLSAIRSGFSRVFNRRELGKATLICLVFLAVEIGLAVVAGIAGSLIEGLAHQPALATIAQAVISLVATGFIGVLIAVYYYDVRIRHEGLDMQAALDSLATPA